MPDSSDCHSGGVVVLAESRDHAIELVKKYTKDVDPTLNNKNYYGDKFSTEPVVLELNKPGVIIYCNGDC